MAKVGIDIRFKDLKVGDFYVDAEDCLFRKTGDTDSTKFTNPDGEFLERFIDFKTSEDEVIQERIGLLRLDY